MCCSIILVTSCSPINDRAISTTRTLPVTIGSTLYTYRGHNNGVTASDVVTDVKWSLDGKYLASASYDKTVQVWSTGNNFTADTLLTYRGHTNWFLTIAWSPDGKYLASGGVDDTVQVWNASSGLSLVR